MSSVNERLGIAETRIDNQEKTTDELKEALFGSDGIHMELKKINTSLTGILTELSLNKLNSKSKRDWLTISIAAAALFSSSLIGVITYTCL
jgi:hypothetical protein